MKWLFRKFFGIGTGRSALAAGGRRTPRRTQLQLEGLENRLVPSTASLIQPDFVIASHAGPSFSSAPNGGYSPAQIRTAYGINNSPATGAGQTIAIVDAYNDPNIFPDLDVFDKQFSATSSGSTLYQQYGSSSSFLTVYNQNGDIVNPVNSGIPVDQTGGWEVEESLDVEWAHAIAPAAKIDLVEANSNNDIILNGNDELTAVQTASHLRGVSVVSMSWGLNEFNGLDGLDGETRYDSDFSTPGVTFLASTGDNSVGEWPAFSPNVLAVGGTTLKLNANNTIQSQTAWSTTGGGTSTVESEPSYQKGFQSTGMRTIPDVSFDADPNTGVAIYDSFQTSTAAPIGWTEIGGTSLAAPSWAGLIAMINQQRAANSLGSLNATSSTQAQTLLYGLSTVGFDEITSGSITSNGHTYNAGPGYNEVTGLGTPIANVLVDRMSDTLHLAGPGNGTDNLSIVTTASGGLQVTFNGVTQSFPPGAISLVYLDAGAGVNHVNVTALPASVTLILDNSTPGHDDIVTIGGPGVSLSNIAGVVDDLDIGGTTALTVDGTGDGTGRTYTLSSGQVRVSGMPGVVDYGIGNSLEVSSLTINGSSGGNTMVVLSTGSVPLTINAGSGTNGITVEGSNSAVTITGDGTNNVDIGFGNLAKVGGPVTISNTYASTFPTTGTSALAFSLVATGPLGKSYVTLDDTNGLTGHGYTISSSSIAVQGGPTVNLGNGVAGVTINGAVDNPNVYTVNSVLASDPVTINGYAEDVLSGPAAGQVTFNNRSPVKPPPPPPPPPVDPPPPPPPPGHQLQ